MSVWMAANLLSISVRGGVDLLVEIGPKVGDVCAGGALAGDDDAGECGADGKDDDEFG